MGTTADKLQYLIDAKSAISAAIEAKGGTVPTELSGYGPAIEALPSGGGGDNEKFQSLVNRSITSVSSSDLGNITSIGNSAFYGCGGLSSITIPNGVTNIASSAFSYCTSLTSITIPDSVTNIGSGAFQTSRNLGTIDFGTTRTTIPTLGNIYAFSSIKSNYQILVPSALLTDWKAANVWNSSSIVNHIVAHP